MYIRISDSEQTKCWDEVHFSANFSGFGLFFMTLWREL